MTKSPQGSQTRAKRADRTADPAKAPGFQVVSSFLHLDDSHSTVGGV